MGIKANHKTAFFWSSGKDSALGLYKLQQSKKNVDHLITMVNDHYSRVTMHGTRQALLMEQLDSIGIPYSQVLLPQSPDMTTYEKAVENKIKSLQEKGFTNVGFGDIFLEDLKSYREKEMHRLQMNTLFPLWKQDTRQLIHEFISLGFKAVTVSVNDTLGSDFLGQEIDEYFVKNLPPDVDPCGENGEFHTFCYDGPIFQSSVTFQLGEQTKRSYPNPVDEGETHFWFIDLLQ